MHKGSTLLRMIHAFIIGFGILWAMVPLHFLRKPLGQAWLESMGQPWNHKFVWTIFAIICACDLVLAPGCVSRPIVGPSLKVFAIAQGLFLLRLVIARIRRETGPGWIAWALLIWTSPFWIASLINLRFNVPWDMVR